MKRRVRTGEQSDVGRDPQRVMVDTDEKIADALKVFVTATGVLQLTGAATADAADAGARSSGAGAGAPAVV